jgi:hypothetical protein
MGAEVSPGARFARSFTVTFPRDSRLMDVRTHACGGGEWKGTVRWVPRAASKRGRHNYVLFPESGG